MSNMLEEAIVDATALREAALKDAETAVVEKYSNEVKEAVSRLLSEQDPAEEDPLFSDDADLGADLEGEAEGEVSTTTMEQVPMAHLEDEGVVEVDLDNILAAAQEIPSDEEYEQDVEDAAENIGIDLTSDDDEEIPGNRPDDEIEINEQELVNIFKEMMVVDVPKIELERAAEALTQDQKEEDEESEFVYTDGMEQEDIDRLRKDTVQLQNENKKLKRVLRKIKGKLEETNLQNARLLYANRVLNDTSLNEQQKSKVVDMVREAKSVDEAKMIFDTLQKTMAGAQNKSSSQSLSEVVSRRSSVILTSNRHQDEQPTDSDPTYNRWATLAGMKK